MRDLPQKGPGEGRWDEAGIHIFGWGVLSPRALGHLVLFLAPVWSSLISTQVVAPSEPNFWTHSLQIHCNGSAGPRSHLSLDPVRKPWLYNLFIYLFFESMKRWCNVFIFTKNITNYILGFDDLILRPKNRLISYFGSFFVCME